MGFAHLFYPVWLLYFFTMTNHKFYIGDSTKVLKGIDDNSIHLMVTSPAYFFVRSYDDEMGIHDGNIGSSSNVNYDEYIKKLNEVWKEVVRVLVPNGKAMINTGDIWIGSNSPIHNMYQEYQPRILKDIMFAVQLFMYSTGEMELFDKIIWYKGSQSGIKSSLTQNIERNIMCLRNIEPCYTFVKKGRIGQNKEISNIPHFRPYKESVWHINPVIKINSKGENIANHPAPYPEELVKRIIEMYTIKGDWVLDPFLGSGTTSVVAKNLGRNSIGIDISDKYIQNAVARMNINQKRLDNVEDSLEVVK